MIPNRPKISDRETDKIVAHFFPQEFPALLVVAVRGYFPNTFFADGKNNFNVWDDAMLVYENGTLLKTFNANTDPSKTNANLAMLDTGIYRFYRGRHKNRIDAFRAYPEGVRLKCKRQDARGRWFEAFCSAINIHDGGATDTWSAGCQTLPNFKGNYQFNEFRDLVYRLMDKHHAKTVTYLLIDEKQMQAILHAPDEGEHLILEIPDSSAAPAEIIPPKIIPPKPEDAAGFGSPADEQPFDSDRPAEIAPPIFGNFGEEIGGIIEEKSGQALGKVSETVTKTTETATGKVEETTAAITDTFNPLNLPAFIPRFGKQWLIGLIPGGFSLATLGAAIGDAPVWMIFALGFISGCATLGFIQLIVKHREIVGAFIVNCYNATANPQMHNLIPTQASGFVGMRKNELLSALGKR